MSSGFHPPVQHADQDTPQIFSSVASNPQYQNNPHLIEIYDMSPVPHEMDSQHGNYGFSSSLQQDSVVESYGREEDEDPKTEADYDFSPEVDLTTPEKKGGDYVVDVGDESPENGNEMGDDRAALVEWLNGTDTDPEFVYSNLLKRTTEVPNKSGTELSSVVMVLTRLRDMKIAEINNIADGDEKNHYKQLLKLELKAVGASYETDSHPSAMYLESAQRDPNLP
jgi:hypothetical protein